MVLYVVEDGVEIIGMKPAHRRVSFIPCELFATVSSGVALNACDGIFQRAKSVEIFKEFLVAHRVERILCTERIDVQHFFHPSLVDHLQHALVDTVIQFIAVAVEPYFHGLEPSWCSTVGAE